MGRKRCHCFASRKLKRQTYQIFIQEFIENQPLANWSQSRCTQEFWSVVSCPRFQLSLKSFCQVLRSYIPCLSIFYDNQEEKTVFSIQQIAIRKSYNIEPCILIQTPFSYSFLLFQTNIRFHWVLVNFTTNLLDRRQEHGCNRSVNN